MGDALVESGALLAALEADAAWARASCVARASPVAVAQLLVCGRARRCHADFLAAARCASVKAPAALRGGFDLCRLALEDLSLDPTLRKEAVAALGGYLGEEVAPEPEELGGEEAAEPAEEEDDLELDETWGGEDAAVTETAEEEDELELDETWGGAPGEDGPAGEAAPESDLELDETWGAKDAAAEPAEEDSTTWIDRGNGVPLIVLICVLVTQSGIKGTCPSSPFSCADRIPPPVVCRSVSMREASASARDTSSACAGRPGGGSATRARPAAPRAGRRGASFSR